MGAHPYTTKKLRKKIKQQATTNHKKELQEILSTSSKIITPINIDPSSYPY